jgi:hypothetical protein
LVCHNKTIKVTTEKLQEMLLFKMDASMARKANLIQERDTAAVELIKLTAEASQTSEAIKLTQHLYALLEETPKKDNQRSSHSFTRWTL